MLDIEKIKELEITANKIRQSVLESLAEAGSGHTAGSLGMADIFTALYFNILNHRPSEPDWPERDRLILSNGHIVPVRYAAMAHAGYFPISELSTLRKLNSRLQGHPERGRLPGLETTSGPIGSGLSQACGIAYVARMDNKKFRTYCIMSDGEQQEGNTWEAMMFAGKNKLSNLTAIIDRNNIQIDGIVEDVMPLEPLKDKYESFNWNVIEISGHDFTDIIDAFDLAKTITNKPTVIIAYTIPGKGVPEIEGDYRWHGSPPGKGPADKIPQKDQLKRFLDDLKTFHGKIENSND
jgi:transketolase